MKGKFFLVTVAALAISARVCAGAWQRPVEPRERAFDPFRLSSQGVTAGHSIEGLISLGGTAPEHGVRAEISASSGAVSVPDVVEIPAGQSGGTFRITAANVRAETIVKIVVRRGLTVDTRSLRVDPDVPFFLSLGEPRRRAGRNSVTAIVRLAAPAPPGGLSFRITSDSPRAVIPQNGILTIPGGRTIERDDLLAREEGSVGPVNITATLGSTGQSVVLSHIP